MKKLNFLMPLMLLGIFATSCKQDNWGDGDMQDEYYTRAFIKQFGLIDPNHTWGFKPAANSGSRSGEGGDVDPGDIDVDRPDWQKHVEETLIEIEGNFWKSPPLIKDWERIAVVQWLHENPNPTGVTLNLTKPYFVTHVGNCHAIAPLTEKITVEHNTYTTLNNNSIYGPELMNNLHVQYLPPSDDVVVTEDNFYTLGSWEHVNNFNASSNTNYNGNTVVSGYGNGGSYDFYYANSRDGDLKYHKYAVIPGAWIDYRLNSYYYICFEYEVYKDAGTMVNVDYKLTADGNTQTRENVELAKCHIDGVGITTEEVLAAMNELGVEAYSIENVTFKGYKKEDRFIVPDGYYDDWIIRICGNAIAKGDPTVPTYPYEDLEAFRIFVEDLSVNAKHDIGNDLSDWDFNDLVFDVKPYDDNGTSMLKITVRALGGTMPIYFGDKDGNDYGQELHSLFGQPVSTMINTGIGPDFGYRTIDVDASVFGFNTGNTEEITIKRPGLADKQVIRVAAEEFNKVRVFVISDGERIEMKAERGGAPSKLCVPSYLAAPTERMPITQPYPRFIDYVQSESSGDFWENHVTN